VLALFVVVAALAAEISSPVPAPAALTADFDGTGRALTAKVSARGKTARLEITGAKGKLLSAVDAPAPGSGSAVRLSGGSLGSPGTLIEVVAAGPREQCRSFWRFREGKLVRLPARRSNQDLPDCARPEGWTARWEKKAADAPAVWVRERTRKTPHGTHQEREVYAFSGFALDFDSARSSGEIGGVSIPVWNDAILYTPSALDILSSRFDLERFRAAPRLRIRADRAQGLFALEFTDHAGRLETAVTATAPGLEPNEIDLTLRTETGKASARVILRGAIVTEAFVAGVLSRWNGKYQPASRLTGGGLEIYARAEDELASNDLVGLWTSDRGEQLAMNLVPGVLGAIDMRRSQLDVSLDPVPPGTDVLLLPRDKTAPAWALVLKGANGIGRVPVRCGNQAAGSWRCETAGPAEAFHRVGGRMNAR
jgi:hypothetical protein